MKTHKTIIIVLSAFLLSSCTKNYQKVVESLKTELAKTGDTIFFYSLDRHFAVWIHADTANMMESADYDELQGAPNVYYYDFDKGEKELLFKSGDSLFCKSWNSYMPLYYFAIGITPDSLGLEIYWDEIEGLSSGLYPLSKRDTVIAIYGSSENGYLLGLDRKDLEITEEFGFSPEMIYEGGLFAAIEVHYNGNGDVVFTSNLAAIYDWKHIPIYTFPKELLENKNELKRYIINSQAYTIKEVINETKNEVNFKEIFENNPKWYKLKVTAIKDFDTEYRVDGDNFSFFTKDKAFARLRYPNEVIIRATVSDIRSAKNSIFMGYFDIFGGNRRNPNADFMFENCELIYYYE